MRKILSLLLICPLAACATPPANYFFENSMTYNQSKDKSWSNLMEYLTSKNFPVKNFDKDSGVVFTDQMQSGPGDDIYADCGTHDLAQTLNNIMQMNILIKPIDAKKSEATVNISSFAIKQIGGYPPFRAECNSNGIAEKKVLNAIGGIKEEDIFKQRIKEINEMLDKKGAPKTQ